MIRWCIHVHVQYTVSFVVICIFLCTVNAIRQVTSGGKPNVTQQKSSNARIPLYTINIICITRQCDVRLLSECGYFTSHVYFGESGSWPGLENITSLRTVCLLFTPHTNVAYTVFWEGCFQEDDGYLGHPEVVGTFVLKMCRTKDHFSAA